MGLETTKKIIIYIEKILFNFTAKYIPLSVEEKEAIMELEDKYYNKKSSR